VRPQPTARDVAQPVRARAAQIDVERIRRDFPILRQRVRNKPLVYLDNAATSQKPQAVIDAVERYYSAENANIHRGVHHLSERATVAYDRARERVQRFLNAAESREIIFVRGTTEAINLVAYSFARPRLKAGDEIVLSVMEHHSNIVPWQLAVDAVGARLRVIPMSDDGTLNVAEYERLLSPRTILVAVTHVSNALGTINPIKQMVTLAHRQGIPVLVDGAQAAPHGPVDVQDLDCDFYVFSGHKTYGPTGIGILYGRASILEKMPPFQGGGDMIRSVTFEHTEFAGIPSRFEAGTPDIGGVIGLEAALEYLDTLGWEGVQAQESALLSHATEELAGISGVTLVGTAPHKAAVLSFMVSGVHPHDVGTIADQDGIALRAGHHCAQPVMDRLGIPATVRASFAFYNTHEEVELLAAAVKRVRQIFG
jgi:cysteine desulfurase/selenocysteine lyase